MPGCSKWYIYSLGSKQYFDNLLGITSYSGKYRCIDRRDGLERIVLGYSNDNGNGRRTMRHNDRHTRGNGKCFNGSSELPFWSDDTVPGCF
jgi:hypothetical protein